MHICIYEDENFMNFEPLIYSRPVYELVCGMNTLKDKIHRTFPKAKVSLLCRKYLEPFVKSMNPDCEVNSLSSNEVLFINGRIIVSDDLNKKIDLEAAQDRIYTSDGVIVAAKLSGKNLEKVRKQTGEILDLKLFDGLPTKEVDVKLVNYLWDLVYLNGEELRKDFKFYMKKKKENVGVEYKKYSGVNFINRKQIFIGKNVEIKPGVVLDAADGPIFIEKNVAIFPNAVIQGPVFIGESSKIKSGAAIYPNVSIGRVCKVGGEVEDSIIMSYTNKQHSGYIGHSYLGSWINLGADTNCSDLQNNYASVKVQINGRHIDSGRQFVGLMMGDHSKTAINTMFNTGTVVGFSANVFGAGFPPRYIPSFSWGGNDSVIEYKLHKAIDTAKAVFARRAVEFNQTDKELFEHIFNLTKEERTKRGY